MKGKFSNHSCKFKENITQFNTIDTYSCSSSSPDMTRYAAERKATRRIGALKNRNRLPAVCNTKFEKGSLRRQHRY